MRMNKDSKKFRIFWIIIVVLIVISMIVSLIGPAIF
jgi:flagellar basal body-associated protein FliL